MLYLPGEKGTMNEMFLSLEILAMFKKIIVAGDVFTKT